MYDARHHARRVLYCVLEGMSSMPKIDSRDSICQAQGLRLAPSTEADSWPPLAPTENPQRIAV